MKFAVLSDTHYISREMLTGEGDEDALLRHKVNLAALEALGAQREIDTVLITGDLTDDGDELSHSEFAALLKKLQNTGKRVYVLTATHDFHFCRAYAMKRGWPVKYRMKPWERPWFNKDACDYKRLVTEEFADLPPEDCVPPLVRVPTAEELWETYREFGRDQAFSVCESAFSYAVKLEEKLWCLMLNNNFRDVDASENMSPGYSPACYQWIESVVEQARAEGAFVFACTHHPLVPPSPAYKIGGTTRNMRCNLCCHTLADLGIPLVFSGHTHFADVAFGSSDNGSVLCNVTTPALSFLPPAYRIAEIFPAENRVRLTAVPVEKTPEMGITEPTLKEYYVNAFINEYRKKVSALPAGLGNVILNMQVRHLYPLCPGCLSAAQYKEIKNVRIFDIIMQCVVNLQCGDGAFTPDTAVYRFMMGLSAALDSMADAQPFVDVNKLLQGYRVKDVMEPLLFNNYVPDNDAFFRFDRLPEPGTQTPAFKSHAGDVLMAVLTAAAALLVTAAPAAAAAVLPALSLLKRYKLKKNPPAPERY